MKDTKDIIENTNQETSTLEEDNPKRHRETTRTKLASIYVYGFLGIILLCFIYAFVFSGCGCFTRDLKDLLLTASGILSGPLGFVFGYYFKNGEAEK